MVQAALYTACRYGELTRLRVGDYKPGLRKLHIREPKGGEDRYIPLNDDAIAFFERQVAGRKKRAFMFRRMMAACERASIEPYASFQVLRHSVAVAPVRKGVPMGVIAKMLGHADTRICERHYAHIPADYVDEVIRENLPDLGGFERDNVQRLT